MRNSCVLGALTMPFSLVRYGSRGLDAGVPSCCFFVLFWYCPMLSPGERGLVDGLRLPVQQLCSAVGFAIIFSSSVVSFNTNSAQSFFFDPSALLLCASPCAVSSSEVGRVRRKDVCSSNIFIYKFYIFRFRHATLSAHEPYRPDPAERCIRSNATRLSS